MARTLAIVLEGVGISACIAGISVEVALRAPIGFIIISVGMTIIAVGALVTAKLMKKKE